MSADDCSAMSESDWSCLVEHGYTFATVQAWSGGYGLNPNLAECVSDAWDAGMTSVDLYMFLCPQCSGNNPPSGAVNSLIQTVQSQGIQYGKLWFDVEQCSGCWDTDDSDNCEFVGEAVSAGQSAGADVGIYSSSGEWPMTVGSGCTSFSDLPLWYAHYDDDAGFDDEDGYSFGGWTSPVMKQFTDSGPCNVDVDQDYMPGGSTTTTGDSSGHSTGSSSGTSTSTSTTTTSTSTSTSTSSSSSIMGSDAASTGDSSNALSDSDDVEFVSESSIPMTGSGHGIGMLLIVAMVIIGSLIILSRR